ncbi:MAG: glycosyltransferase family 4 protein [Desulfovibrionaceae bacterium]
MRILQVINVRWFNATAWYALYQSRLLAEAGHDVLIACLPGSPAAHTAKAWGLTAYPMDLNARNPLRILALARDIHRLIAAWRPEVVNCHRGESFILWGLARRLGGFRLVRTRGDQRPPRNNLPNRWLHRHVADAVVVTNTAMARVFRDALGVPHNRLHCIYGGVDTKAFAFDPAGRDRVRAEYGFGPGDVVVGLLGRYDRVKGQKELIEAVARLRHGRGMRQVKLMLIGHDSAMRTAEMEAWITEDNMADATVLTGRRNDVAACISALDVGVVASLWSETIARAALEIMACGRLLLSTSVGVMPDLLDRAVLVQPGDASALAGLLERVATDPKFAASQLRDQQNRITQLTGNDFLRQCVALYQGLVDG